MTVPEGEEEETTTTPQETPMEEQEADISKPEGDHDDDGDHHHDHHSEEFHLYSRPRQRQKWGESQVLPHTNFNDLFFDLIYVGAAYNLGSLIRASPTSKGFLYFVGCFYPIMMLWFQKTMYDSRFDAGGGRDLYHDAYECLVLVVLATAVLYIRPVAYLSTPSTNEDMLVFAACITASCFLAMGRCVDVIRNVDGEPSAKKQGSYDLKMFAGMAVFYIAATVLAAFDYFGGGAGGIADTVPILAGDTNRTDDEGIRRALAAAGDYGDVNHTPIVLLVVGSLMYNAGVFFAVFRSSFDKNYNPQEFSVPLNIGFFIHRFGEWILLMLGESVLSLLIVPTERGDYYKAFFCGILSITILEVLYFQSQPHDADDHALRRSRWGGITYITFGQIYSAALIVLGTSYKMILYEFVYENNDEGASSRRSLSLLREVGYTPGEILGDPFVHRFLASAGPPIEDAEVRQQHVAHFFCISMAVVWLCLDVMLLANRGVQFNLKRCERRSGNNRRKTFFAISMVLVRGSLIVGFGTMSWYCTDPVTLAFLGLCGIIVQVGLRLAGSSAFDDETDLPPECCKTSERNINGPKALFRQSGTRNLGLLLQE